MNIEEADFREDLQSGFVHSKFDPKMPKAVDNYTESRNISTKGKGLVTVNESRNSQ